MTLLVHKIKSFKDVYKMTDWILSAYSFVAKTDGKYFIQSRLIDDNTAEVKIFNNEFTNNN